MNPSSSVEFLSKLHHLKVVLTAEGDRLRFTAPPGVMTAELRKELSDHKANLLAMLRDSLPGKQSLQIQRAPRDGNLPLSFAQESLWFLTQMQGVSETYHMPIGLRLRGQLNSRALRRALDRILARHEALRTTFSVSHGDPAQRISDPEDSHFRLVEHDLRGQRDAKGELDRLIELEIGAPFDLEEGPVIRGRLIQLADNEHVLLITAHHIASDAWSTGLLCNELSALYGAFLSGQEDRLPKIEIQYADYSVWHRSWVKSDQVRRQSEYWKTKLAGAPALLELPTDHPRPAVQDHNGAIEEIVLDERLTAALREFSKRHRVTVYMTLLGAWAALLSRLSGQPDVVIGTPVANRQQRNIEELIGFFANTVALRLNLSGSPTVSQLLELAKECALGALQHQDLPFESVVDLIHPVRNLAYSPVFQVMFGWYEFVQRVELPGVEAEPLHLPHHKAKFDLSILLQNNGNTIVGVAEYATSLFEPETIKRYLGYFRNLLEAMVADETQVVGCLPMLSTAERQRVLYEWNETKSEYPSDKCVHELFEVQVEKTPDAVAVVFEDDEISYAELNRRANQLAHYLREQGLEPDDRVAICVERSLEMIVGLLGILKAGGAYVPLDPAYPVERLRFMLQDADPVVLLTQTHLLELFSGLASGLPVVELEATALPWQDRPESNPDPRSIGLTSEHLAYVIYTSGSTGQPKGVAMPHRALCNLLYWQIEQSATLSARRILQFAALGFDVAFQEIGSTLCAGNSLVLIRESNRLNSTNLFDYIAENEIQRLFLPYAALSLFADGAENARNISPDCDHASSGVLEIVTAGEQLRMKPAITRLFKELNCRLQNQYGPTETHVASSFNLSTNVAQWPTLPPIGRPIANARIYILDEYGAPVPVGVAGELYIGGAGVARGYLNRAELTAKKFLFDPFSDEPGARMYRTGDLGRYLADGNIEFLGRNDFQVKIRGFRIELGEIEARLMEHPGVREAVVVAREDTPGDKRLAAYYTSAEETGAPGAEELRSHLSALLPDYMVPAAYVRLGALPLTANGKLDRRSLPMPEADAYSTQAYDPPEGEVEEKLAVVWAEVLKLDRVGRHDNFFALGGDSIMSVRVVTRANREGIKLNVTAMIANQTIAELAAAVESVNRDADINGISSTISISQSSETQDLGERVEIEI